MLADAQTLERVDFRNISKIFSDTPRHKEHLKVVRVVNHTANLTNGNVLVRRQVTDVPDGVYQVSRTGGLAPVPYREWMRYPDIEMIRPPFETMHPLCEFRKEALESFIPLCQQVKAVQGNIIISMNAMYCQQNNQMYVQYPFSLPGEEVRFDPAYLEIAFIEMLQYPVVYLLRDFGSDETTPLVIGQDWGSCALVMPLSNTYYG